MSIQFCVSEQETSTLYCPMGIASANPAQHWCAGKQCMAWRWVKTNINDGHGGPLIESSDTHGYCGLAGKPWGEK